MIHRLAPLVQVTEPAPALQELDLSLDDVHGLGDVPLEAIAPGRPGEGVGVLTLG